MKKNTIEILRALNLISLQHIVKYFLIQTNKVRYMQIFRKVTESTSFIRSMSVATFTLPYVNRKYTLRVGFIAYC